MSDWAKANRLAKSFWESVRGAFGPKKPARLPRPRPRRRDETPLGDPRQPWTPAPRSKKPRRKPSFLALMLRAAARKGRREPGAKRPGREVSVHTPEADLFFGAGANWLPVRGSTNVDAIGYFLDVRPRGRNVLAVRFIRHLRVYFYFDAKPELFRAMMAAASKGKFTWSDLRDRYDYQHKR